MPVLGAGNYAFNRHALTLMQFKVQWEKEYRFKVKNAYLVQCLWEACRKVHEWAVGDPLRWSVRKGF